MTENLQEARTRLEMAEAMLDARRMVWSLIVSMSAVVRDRGAWAKVERAFRDEYDAAKEECERAEVLYDQASGL